MMYPFSPLQVELLGTDFDQGRLLQAVCFAADKHQHQRRKNIAATPYINHPLQVAQVLWQVGSVHDSDILIAAILHDTLEDTNTEVEELLALFGAPITHIVEEVSDDTRLCSTDRKRLQVEKAASLSLGAQQIKLADKICNIQDIASAEESPQGWDLARKQAYLCWSMQVSAQIKTCNAALFSHYEAVLKQSCDELHISRESLCSTPSSVKITKTV